MGLTRAAFRLLLTKMGIKPFEYGIKVVMLSSKTAGDVFQFDVYTTSPHIVDARYRGARQLACVAPQYDPTLPDLDVWTPGRQLELKVSSRGNSSFSEATCYDSGTGQTTTGATLLKDEDHTIYISGYYTDTAAYTYEVAYQGDGTFEAYKWSAGGARDVSETIVSANIATAPTHIDSSVYVAWANTENKTAGSYCRFTANPAFLAKLRLPRPEATPSTNGQTGRRRAPGRRQGSPVRLRTASSLEKSPRLN